MIRELDEEKKKIDGDNTGGHENQQNRFIMDGDHSTDHVADREESIGVADRSRDQLIDTERDDDDADDVIGAVLHMVDVADGDLRRLSSRSSASSISPRSLPVGGAGQREENEGRSQNQTPDSNQNGSGVDEDLVNSPVLTVACGYLAAKLHMDRFYCPGIHQLCIEYNGQFLTPKQFTIVAAKDKQKDWKGAIKINRQPVRILFERNLLDFYKHSEYCSGRCVSKSYKPLDPSASSSSTTTNGVEFIQHANASFLNGADATTTAIGRAAAEIAAFANGFVVKSEMDEEEEEEEQLQQQQQYNRRRASGCNNSDISAVFRNAANNGIDLTTAVHGSPSLMQTEPVLYWNCVSQLGLFHELTQEIEQQLQVLKTSFGIPELRPKAAKKLSELVRVLDIGEKIQQKLIAKRTYANAQCALLATELSELRKIAETQEKKQREVKRKSELLDHLIGSLQNQKRKRRASNSTFGSDISAGVPLAMSTANVTTVQPSPTHALPSP